MVVVRLMFTGSMINYDYCTYLLYRCRALTRLFLFSTIVYSRFFCCKDSLKQYVSSWCLGLIIIIIGISFDTSQCICNHYQCLFNIEVLSVRNLTIKNIFHVWHLEDPSRHECKTKQNIF